MEEGFWTAIFSSGSLAGGGIVYLSAGRLIGGDSQFYYAGTYLFSETTKLLEATAIVMPFVAGAISIFGVPTPRYELRLRGFLGPQEAVVTGYIPHNPHMTMNVKLVKRLERQF